MDKNRWLKLLGIGLGTGLLGYLMLSRMDYVMPISQIPEVLCWNNCQPQPYHPFSTPLPVESSNALEELIPANVSAQDVSLYVEKSKSRLTLFHKRTPIKSYAMVLGNEPVGDKQREGDYKTPKAFSKLEICIPIPPGQNLLG